MKHVLFLLLIIGLLILGFYAFNAYIYNEKQGDFSRILEADEVQVILN